MIIACPEMSLVEFKQFNMHIIAPHEALMSLEPDLFPWECKILTDYNLLLNKISNQEAVDNQEDIMNHEYKMPTEETALVHIDQKHRELIPIFSS